MLEVFLLFVFVLFTQSCFPLFHPLTLRRQWRPTPVLLPGKSHGRRNLVGCSPWGLAESDTTERLHFHFSLSYTGGGNGNPLQCSCLENPRDDRAWWAAVYGVTQSWTRLKRLSSSSNPLTVSPGGQWPVCWEAPSPFHAWGWGQVSWPLFCTGIGNGVGRWSPSQFSRQFKEPTLSTPRRSSLLWLWLLFQRMWRGKQNSILDFKACLCMRPGGSLKERF